MRAKLVKVGIITTALIMMLVGNSGAKEKKEHFRSKKQQVTREYKWSNPIYRHMKHYRSQWTKPYFKHHNKHRNHWRKHRRHNYQRHHHYYFAPRGYRRHHK